MTGTVASASQPQLSARATGIILDGCALLNLYASRRIAEILQAQPHPCAVAEYVRVNEALWVGRHRGGTHGDSEKVDLSPLIECGQLQCLSLNDNEETSHFISLASLPALDDGEAVCGALAHSRGLMVATDDRAANRAFAQHNPPIPTCSTASLVKRWADIAGIDRSSLRRVLCDIRERAYFEPGHRDPLHPWWQAALDAA